ncbi:MAG: hypothetical protein QF436_00735 [Candidatus Woesearchaeota archaeon]|jgi:tRNA (guanine26-N2/guanine27-N2)-dimethyltransferase|nr:hypothetical protein [Candidatus Woesearchaeota archaeon]MDP7622625.1 hypothetical protein [Candidatus Woesearchaeota archaeon]HJN57341.1 hypothetical protein [Candidatus Woesearchaeota archaeon]|tara:strand:+ start:24325 stop:25488 length:1164 start_codon:yes stop_codon:yes gene_type:complete
MKLITEGSAKISIKTSDKVSKDMDVFYNPVMKLNRDISVLLLNSINKKNIQISLPLAGSGIRGIRFLKELNKGIIKSISFNDCSKKAVNSIKNSLSLNKINNFKVIKKNNNISNKNNHDKKISIHNEDANLFLLNSTGFDYIDIDPFGSSNPYLESAVKRLSRDSILAVTNTDTAALSGTYPNACIRNYWAVPKRDYMMHETGLRILVRKIQLVAMQHDKALFPIFSYFKDHYFRIFFQCIKGKKETDKIPKQHGMFNNAGPLWTGNLWDDKLVNKMHSELLKKSIENKKTIKNNKTTINKKINDNQNHNEILKFLKTIKEESKINTIGFYDIHDIAKKRKIKIISKKEDIIKKIRKKGYKAASTHFSGTGIRSDIAYNKLISLLKE